MRQVGAPDHAHPHAVLPEQRPGLGGAEERDARGPGGGLLATGRPRSRPIAEKTT